MNCPTCLEPMQAYIFTVGTVWWLRYTCRFHHSTDALPLPPVLAPPDVRLSA
jgi:hypothetical protein